MGGVAEDEDEEGPMVPFEQKEKRPFRARWRSPSTSGIPDCSEDKQKPLESQEENRDLLTS